MGVKYVYNVVISTQSNPPISQFNSLWWIHECLVYVCIQ